MGALVARLRRCPERSAIAQLFQALWGIQTPRIDNYGAPEVRRHIYKSGAGPPPGRAGTLVSTEDVRPDSPCRGVLWAHLLRGLDDDPDVVLLRDLGDQPAPRLWKDLDVLRAITPREGSAVALFPESRDIAIRTALRGTD